MATSHVVIRPYRRVSPNLAGLLLRGRSGKVSDVCVKHVNMGGIYSDFMKPDITPKWREDPTFDPNYGFPSGRKERKAIATEEELIAAGIPADQRDYCAHLLLDFYQCRQEKFPWVVRCKHEKHKWEQCEYEDWVLRMKEYERERRLLERAKRKALKSSVEQTIGA